MAEILVPESRQFVDIEPASCQSHNVSGYNALPCNPGHAALLHGQGEKVNE
jgi:hypothetical protein